MIVNIVTTFIIGLIMFLLLPLGNGIVNESSIKERVFCLVATVILVLVLIGLVIFKLHI